MFVGKFYRLVRKLEANAYTFITQSQVSLSEADFSSRRSTKESEPETMSAVEKINNTYELTERILVMRWPMVSERRPCHLTREAQLFFSLASRFTSSLFENLTPRNPLK